MFISVTECGKGVFIGGFEGGKDRMVKERVIVRW